MTIIYYSIGSPPGDFSINFKINLVDRPEAIFQQRLTIINWIAAHMSGYSINHRAAITYVYFHSRFDRDRFILRWFT